MILAMQDPDNYPDVLKNMSDSEKDAMKVEADNVERFISLSDKKQGSIYRGVSFNSEFSDKKAMDATLDSLKEGKEISMGHIASWSTNEGTARSYADGAVNAEFGSGEDYSIVYRVGSNKSAVSLSGINPEGECLSPKSAKYRVTKVDYHYDDDGECHRYVVDVEEI